MSLLSHSEDNKMSSVIVYCQAHEKISIGSADFSVRYRGRRGEGQWGRGGVMLPISREIQTHDTAETIVFQLITLKI